MKRALKPSDPGGARQLGLDGRRGSGPAARWATDRRPVGHGTDQAARGPLRHGAGEAESRGREAGVIPDRLDPAEAGPPRRLAVGPAVDFDGPEERGPTLSEPLTLSEPP